MEKSAVTATFLTGKNADSTVAGCIVQEIDTVVNIADLQARHQEVFPGSDPTFLIRAPGRVNLIGEHTDYNAGLVLPIAMQQALYITAAPGDDGHVAVHSTAFQETTRFSAEDPGPPADPFWSNYVRGTAAMLVRQGFKLTPARLMIHSEVPIGGGVSSSAALEVGAATALLTLASQRMDPKPLALLARQAEHEYANSPCGIMDQFICVLGQDRHALLLDCRSHQYSQIPLPFEHATLVVMNTQVKHSIGSSQYPVRQNQCRQGLTIVQAATPEAETLRDVSIERLNSLRARMEPVIFQRCRHVVTEIDRTMRASDALRAGNLETFGQLMFESHASLRDDYAVSCDELDHLVEIARNTPGVFGARMTGGGFGGCAIALIRRENVAALRSAIVDRYDPRFEQPAIVYETTASCGVSAVPTQKQTA